MELEKNKVLVITGAVCSEKTHLIKRIAQKHGKYSFIQGSHLEYAYSKDFLISNQPNILIIYGDITREGYSKLKRLIIADKINYVDNDPVITVQTPNYFIWDATEVPSITKNNSRRFFVIDVNDVEE